MRKIKQFTKFIKKYHVEVQETPKEAPKKSRRYLPKNLEEKLAPISKYIDITPGKGHPNMTKEEILFFLSPERTKEEDRALFELANTVTEKHYGKTIFFRGIIENSNICEKDCNYCGIRKHMPQLHRYTMTKEEIIEQAMWAHENKYGSICLQSGEFNNEKRLKMIEEVIREIKQKTSPIPGKGLGVALCLGEVNKEWYQRWYDAGAHRYLLRIEASNPDLYRRLHPNDDNHSWEKRVQCLKDLQDIGYQIGTGMMIQVPGQTLEDLASDILFFKQFNIDMIGMGPYIVQKDTPIGKKWLEENPNVDMKAHNKQLFNLSLKMIALCRLILQDVNICATTALQAINPAGREIAFNAGANMVMPIITPQKYRADYQLYEGKPCIDDTEEECKNCLSGRIRWSGKQLVLDGTWGDPLHAKYKKVWSSPIGEHTFNNNGSE